MYEKLKKKVRHLSYAHHTVSTKAILVNDTKDKVLMTHTPYGGFGLPGGHIDKGEPPDTALHRELFEELGIKKGVYKGIYRHGFMRDDSTGRIILFYVGSLSEDAPLTLDPKEILGTQWVSIKDITTGVVPKGRYTDYIQNVLQSIRPVQQDRQ